MQHVMVAWAQTVTHANSGMLASQGEQGQLQTQALGRYRCHKIKHCKSMLLRCNALAHGHAAQMPAQQDEQMAHKPL